MAETSGDTVVITHVSAVAGGTPRVTFGLLYAGFLLAGGYTTLLGTSLPLLTERWGLQDSHAGTLFLAQFFGSMLGSLLQGSRLLGMVGVGFALVGVSCAALAVIPAAGALAALFCFGLGLGIAMTSTSVWITGHAGPRHASALAALNAVWALGAGVAPWLLLPWAVPATLSAFLGAFALPAFAVAVALAVVREHDHGAERIAEPSSLRSRTRESRPGSFASLAIVLGFLSFSGVGVETGLGGWMTTYLSRTHGAALTMTGAASGFWFGLLSSRIVSSLVLLAGLPAEVMLLTSLLVAALATAALLTAQSAPLIMALAFFCGAGIGPLYPLVLSYALRIFRGRWVFALAGLGGALVPWWIGVLSKHTGSIRVALWGMLALLATMVLSVAASWRRLRRPGGSTS